MISANKYKQGYKKTKIGWIPEEWCECKLALATEKITVGIATEVRPYVVDQGVPIIRNQNIKAGKFDDSDIIYINEEFDVSNRNKRVKTGDVIIVRTGSNVGKACIVPDKFNNAQTFTTLIVRTNEKLHSEYLSLHVNSYGLSEIKRLSAGAGKPNLNAGFLKDYCISFPPLPEQQKIAEILSTWDKGIMSCELLIKSLKQRKKGLMQQLLTGKTRLKGFSGEWKDVKLSKYFTQRNETNHVELPLLSVGINGVYPQDDSVKKDTSNSDKSKYKRICVGDIGYNTMRMWQGRSALSSLEGIVSPAYTIVTPKENADSLFFSYLFKLEYVVHRFYRNSQGLVSDTWQCRFKDFSIVKVFCPPSIEEQQAIAKVLITADKEIKVQENYLAQLQEQKKGLMQQLLTGQKRVMSD